MTVIGIDGKAYQHVADITGKTWGKLTAVRFAYTRKAENTAPGKKTQSRTYWEYVCTCGNHKILRTSDVINGRVTTCGKCPRPPRAKTKIVYKPAPLHTRQVKLYTEHLEALHDFVQSDEFDRLFPEEQQAVKAAVRVFKKMVEKKKTV